MSEHHYSIERLVRYQCGACGKWWSIGDGPVGDNEEALHYPWCGQFAPLGGTKSEPKPDPIPTLDMGFEKTDPGE